MEELPDELLLHVLGFLRDGATLLDCVSLVCKRWRRLAFEPSLWERVCVDVPPCYHRSGSAELFEMVSRAARVVLHAPALLQVDLECFSCELWDELDDDVLFGIGPPACAEHADMKLSALLRTGAKVSRVTNLDSGPGEAPLLPLLQKLSPHLRELHMSSTCEEEHMRALEAMPVLRRLDVHCGGSEDGAVGDPGLPLRLEELRIVVVNMTQLLDVQRMPRLWRLTLHDMSFEEDVALPPTPLAHSGLRWLSVALNSEATLLSLVRAHGSTLEELEVGTASYKHGHDEYGWFPGLADGLARCGLRALRRLSLQRHVPRYYEMAHNTESCRVQLDALTARLAPAVVVKCVQCDGGQMFF